MIQNPQIEIERKFIVPDDYHERLTAQGFQLQKEFDEILEDKYYDTHQHVLINEDHWLRQRNGDWELKYPVGVDAHTQVRKVDRTLKEREKKIGKAKEKCEKRS